MALIHSVLLSKETFHFIASPTDFGTRDELRRYKGKIKSNTRKKILHGCGIAMFALLQQLVKGKTHTFTQTHCLSSDMLTMSHHRGFL